MSEFSTALAAHDWARSYGYSYTYRVIPQSNGMFRVEWNYNEPHGC